MSTGSLWTQVELSRKLNLGWRYLRAEQTEAADQSFQEGAELARSKGLPCWELQFEAARVQIPIYYTFDQEAAVTAAVKLTSRSREARYETCAERVSAYDVLIHAYFYRDCIGYETEIRVAAAYVDEAFPQVEEIRLRMDYIRAELDLELGKHDEAQQRIQRYLAAAQKAHPFRLADGYRALYRLAYARGNLTEALRAAREATRYDQEGAYQRGAADTLLAQAVFAKHLGDDGAAQSALQQGLDHYKQYNLRKALPYYDSLATFHELDGSPEIAYALRREQFDSLTEAGSLHDLAKAHLQHIRLCGRLQKPMEDPLQAAFIFQEELRRPEWFAERLEAIMNGDYWEFPWQAP